MKPPAFSSTDLSVLQDQLDSWRQRQTGRCRLPADAWDAATELAAIRGVSPVARALHIDFYKLQRRVRALAMSVTENPVPHRFVELKLELPPPDNAAGGWVELFDGPHRRMRLQTGHDPATWLALAQGFWRPLP